MKKINPLVWVYLSGAVLLGIGSWSYFKKQEPKFNVEKVSKSNEKEESKSNEITQELKDAIINKTKSERDELYNKIKEDENPNNKVHNEQLINYLKNTFGYKGGGRTKRRNKSKRNKSHKK